MSSTKRTVRVLTDLAQADLRRRQQSLAEIDGELARLREHQTASGEAQAREFGSIASNGSGLTNWFSFNRRLVREHQRHQDQKSALEAQRLEILERILKSHRQVRVYDKLSAAIVKKEREEIAAREEVRLGEMVTHAQSQGCTKRWTRSA